jgi:propanol-preferring alcohol dehydrogenase
LKAAVLYELAEIEVEVVERRYPHLPLKREPLVVTDVQEPSVGRGQVLIRVEACGVCYTDIDIIEGRVACKLPLIPGHQVVGRVVEVGSDAAGLAPGDRVGVAWIGHACGSCTYCSRGLENLCVDFKATGCHIDGGYAEYTVAYADYVYKAPESVEATRLAPLMCAGAVGYRALKLTGLRDGERLGLFGFGASAHIVIQVARRLYPSSEIYVFTRSPEHQEMARRLGADWVGSPRDDPPRPVDKAIDFTPVGEMIARALEVLAPGGRLVVNVIRKQTPTSLVYDRHLWLEREVKTVANVTRRDVKELLEIAARWPIETHVEVYRLEEVNEALRRLKAARVKGSAVLRIS